MREESIENTPLQPAALKKELPALTAARGVYFE